MTRKELVHKIAEHLGVTPVYLGAPTFAYRVGEYTVDRHSNIFDSQERVVTLEDLLADAKEEAAVRDETTVTEPVDAERAETGETLTIQIPLEGYDGKSLRNLLHIIYSRQHLIKKALGLEADLVNEKVITALDQARMATREQFRQALEGVDLPGVDIDFAKEIISFKLAMPEATEKAMAATQLLGLVNLSARRLKSNISAKVKHTDNEKFTFRTWLVRLGMIGDEYKAARRVLLQPLSGNSAFRQPEGA